MRIIIEIDEQNPAPAIRTTTAAETREPSQMTGETSTKGIDAGPAPARSGEPDGRDPGIDPETRGDGARGATGDSASDVHLDAGTAPDLAPPDADVPLPVDDEEDLNGFG
jgi:hypothetical protein